jgi:hypothetical protein
MPQQNADHVASMKTPRAPWTLHRLNTMAAATMLTGVTTAISAGSGRHAVT